MYPPKIFDNELNEHFLLSNIHIWGGGLSVATIRVNVIMNISSKTTFVF